MSWPDTVRKSDLEIKYYRGSGPGGQHRNKVETACRMKHIPTGITTCSEEFKSQAQNKKAAFRKLASKLTPIMKNEPQKERNSSGTEVVRTYNKANNPRDKAIGGIIVANFTVVGYSFSLPKI